MLEFSTTSTGDFENQQWIQELAENADYDEILASKINTLGLCALVMYTIKPIASAITY